MSTWEMGSAPNAGGIREVTINFANDDASGTVGGTLTFKGEAFTVHGAWSAAGSTPGRNGSSCAFWGADSSAIDYIAAVGTIDLEGAGPASIQLNLIRVQDSTGQQYAWSGVLKPLS